MSVYLLLRIHKWPFANRGALPKVHRISTPFGQQIEPPPPSPPQIIVFIVATFLLKGRRSLRIYRLPETIPGTSRCNIQIYRDLERYRYITQRNRESTAGNLFILQ